MNVSIIIPVYNSSLMLVELCERIFKIMKKLNLQNNFELILINDYSFDDSWQKIKHLSNQNFYIKGINLSENFGQHNAIMAGLNNCSGEFIITIDDDLQHPPEYIPAILKELNNYDVCYTNYRNRKHVGWKKFVSKLNNIVSSFILDKPLKVYMSSFRGFTKTINQKLINFKEKDIYLDGLIIKYTKNIAMITVDHQERKIGESNYNFKKLFILWSNMILNFSFFPFRVASIFGITLKIFIKLFRKKSGKPQFIIKEIINGKK
jgi:undecaprenyl-phosphate 4-deoxy-4-formamido-L-arabinose transferase